MKRRYVIGNWKTHPTTRKEAERIIKDLKKSLPSTKRTNVVVCPPTTYLASLTDIWRSTNTRVDYGVQDIAAFTKGSHTGEILPSMFVDLGAKYAIVGHSERRAIGETSAHVAAKLKIALESGLVGVLCFGERERDKDGEYLRFLERQLCESLEGISRQRAAKLLVAYEPIWAIGKTSDEAMTPQELHQTILFVRKVLCKIYGRKAGENIPVLYGGSVEPANDESLIHHAGHSDIDGFLVGHASLVAEDFASIVRTVDSVV